MPANLKAKTEILPKAQQEIWPLLTAAPGLAFVLYGGTAVALHLGHRTSIDFDFFRAEPEPSTKRRSRLLFLSCAPLGQFRKIRTHLS